LQRTEHSRKHQATALRDADILSSVRLLPSPEQSIVVGRDRFSQFIEATERTVGLVLRLDGDATDALGRAGHVTDLRLALSEITPIWVAIPEAALHSLLDDPDHAHERNISEPAHEVRSTERFFIFPLPEFRPMGLRSFLHRLTAPARGDASYQASLGPVKLVLIVDASLKMGKGKIAAQVGHASVEAALQAAETYPDEMAVWMASGQQKVVLKGDSEALSSMMDAAKRAHLPVCSIRDAGRTQIPAGSLTVVAIGPAGEDEIDAITGELKLL
jgi:PTH2 family peptidyl-tRNA hydrolase